MESIGDQVYIDNQYPGVTIGVISHPRGLVQIDAPPSPEDGRSWRAAMMNLDGGPERVLIILDAHHDRSLGARAMDCTIIAHENATQVFRNRPSTFKIQSDETGENWETLSGLAGIRWAIPEISFTDEMTLYWGAAPILLQHHPGPSSGATWIVLPEQKIAFIGDAVLKNQPPFLATADIPVWLETLSLLQSKEFSGFTIISSRGGAVSATFVKKQVDFLKDVHKRVEKLSKRKHKPDALENLVQPLLSNIRAPAALQKQYAQRLRHGLHKYYAHHYQNSKKD